LRRAALVVLLVLAGCAVRHETPEGIVIEHNALHPELADIEAQKHCARYGKKAVLVKRTAAAPSPSLLYMRSRVSIYDCVEG